MAGKTIGQQVLENLEQYIVQRRLGPGDRLPPERELAAELGVSRGTMREALEWMESIGALSRHPRRGSVLQPVDLGVLAQTIQFLVLRAPADLAELFVARRMLEVSILDFVVVHATEADFARMEQANALMETELVAGTLGVSADRSFHRALFSAAGNKFLAQMGALLQGFFLNDRTRFVANIRHSRRTVEEHREIIRALRDNNLPRAREVMCRHMDAYVRQHLVALPDAAAAEECKR